MVCARSLLFVLLCGAAAWAQSTVFVVRHADRYGTEPDPSITPVGQRQAESLARLLADVHITRIFISEALRTRQTAAPTAELFRVKPVSIDATNQDDLIRQVRAGLRDGEATLIVGHRSTVPKIVKALSGKDVAPLAVDEYDRLQVVTVFPGRGASVLTLHLSR
jgi:phosphohistidine phosphatase SixA